MKCNLKWFLNLETSKDKWNKRSGAQAGIRTRVLRATAAYTGPNYTTWAQAPQQYIIIQLINLSRKYTWTLKLENDLSVILIDIHWQITKGWVKKGTDQHWLQCGSAKILDLHPAFAVGFSFVCVKLRCTLCCFSLHFFGSRLNLLPVFQAKISWNMGFRSPFQRFVLCGTDLLFVVGIWLLTWNNNRWLSGINCSLCVGGLQEGRIVKAA